MSALVLSGSSTYARGVAPFSAVPYTFFIAARADSFNSINAVMYWGDPAVATNLHRAQINSDGTFRVLSSNVAGTSTALTTNTTSVGATFRAVAVYGANNSRRAILNGNFAGQGSSTGERIPDSAHTRFSIGRTDTTSGAQHQFPGAIFHAALWTVALVDEEITALSKGAWPASIRPGALKSFWPVWGPRAGTQTRDWRGNCHLTIGGTTTVSQDSVPLLGRRRTPWYSSYVAEVIPTGVGGPRRVWM
jgi:hypothetical protein